MVEQRTYTICCRLCCVPLASASCLQLTNGAMFRKKQDVAERSRSLLKNSAAKKIKAEILVALPLLTKDVIDELMPNKVRLPINVHLAPIPHDRIFSYNKNEFTPLGICAWVLSCIQSLWAPLLQPSEAFMGATIMGVICPTLHVAVEG